MKIIGICGFQGSGKDTLANILINKYNYKKLSFASSLKDIVSVIFNWDRNLLEGITDNSRKWREEIDPWWSKRLNIPNLTPRYILQTIGTDVFRDCFHSQIWIASLERKLDKYDKIVIPDCRFLNEIELIRNKGGTMIRIDRNNSHSHHISETEWTKADFDIIIDNSGTIEELEKKLNFM
jgi:dephospho-CoA kinase